LNALKDGDMGQGKPLIDCTIQTVDQW